MKVITEAILRDELRASRPEEYVIPEGKILSPAAREYLQQLKIKIVSNIKHRAVTISGDIPYNAQATPASNPVNRARDSYSAPVAAAPAEPQAPATPKPAAPAVNDSMGVGMDKPKYVDYETGAYYFAKPEQMTQLKGNQLVPKGHRRIVFRGYLDNLEAEFLLVQTELMERGGFDALVDDIEDVVNSLREMMRADCLDDAFKKETIIGLSHDELRERSHNPMKFYNIKQMLLPSKDLGRIYALLNSLRTKVRMTEVVAVQAYENGNTYERTDIIEELNRASSAMHILMCKYLAGDYSSSEEK